MKRRVIIIFVVLSLLLTSCALKSTQISNDMMIRITKAYYKEYILPNDEDARIEDTLDYFRFLKRFKVVGEKLQVYLFAWTVFEETEEWGLVVNGNSYLFEHDIVFLVFNNNDRKFYSVDDAIEKQFFSTNEFEDCLIGFNTYIDNFD